MLTYDDDNDTCTAQALWPRRTSAVEIASRDATDEDETDEHQTYHSALDGVVMTVLIPSQQLPADVTDSEHWTTFLSAAHEHRFDGLRGERVVSGTKWHHPAARLLAHPQLVLLGTTGTELNDLFDSDEGEWSGIVAKVMRGEKARAPARH